MRNATLKAEDFAAGQIPAGPQGAQGPQGPQGLQGVQGPEGKQGAEGPANPNADLLDGLNSDAFAAAGHNHDAAYVNEGQAGSVNGAMIEDYQTFVHVPLATFHDCDTGNGALLDYTSGNDAVPDFTAGTSDGTGYRIQFDVDATPDQDTQICAEVILPNYVSGGTVFALAGKATNNAGGAERLEFGLGTGGTAPTVFGSTDLANATSLIEYGQAMSIPAGAPLMLSLSVDSPTTMNDQVSIYHVGILYTASR